MPSFITHALIGSQIRQRLSNSKVSGVISQFPVAFDWGAQGPDLLFFRYGFKRKPNPLGGLGTRIHKEHTPELFAEICRYLSSLQGTERFEPALSYVCGFVCHYCLDKNIHPYVYFMQEKLRSRYYSSVPYGIHMKLETDIDTALYTNLTGDSNIRHYKISPTLIQKEADIQAMCDFFSHILHANYQAEYPSEEIKPCAPNQFRKETFMLEPTGFISGIACKWMDLTRGQHNVQCANCRPRQVKYDVLNLEHTPWKNFRKKDALHHESVLDLLNLAQDEAIDLIGKIDECVRGGQPFPLTDMPTFDDGNPDKWGM